MDALGERSVSSRMLDHLEIWLGAGLPLERFRANYEGKYNELEGNQITVKKGELCV